MRNFWIGLGVGVGLGLLFAPSSGSELRGNISGKASDLADSAREKFENTRNKITGTFSSAKTAYAQATGTETR